MIATFRETAASLQDLKYGAKIIKLSVGQTIWYWTRYLILFLILACVLGLAALVYYTPQLPKLANDNLPDITLSVKDGKASANVPQPFVRGDDKFSFIIDTKGTGAELDKFKTGVLLTGDKLITKSETETKVMSLKNVQNFTGSKTNIVDWLKSHELNLLLIGLVAIILFAAFGGLVYGAWSVIVMALWAILLFLLAKILKKKLEFINALKIIAYASVPSLLISIVGFFFPSSLFSLISLAALLFYAIAWTYHLTPAKK